MARLILTFTAIVALGIAGWSLHARMHPPAAAAAPGTANDVAAAPAARSSADEISALRTLLDDERAARRQLETEIERLRVDLQLLTQDLEALEKSRPEAQSAAAKVAERPRPRSRWLDKARLEDSGLGQTEIDAIAHDFDKIEMDKLQLQNSATREGWRDTSRFLRESADLQARTRELRNELDDERYDWLLYATGQPNRVAVHYVLAGSPAASNGVLPGDVITSYDRKRVYTQAELVAETTQGRAGDIVVLELMRDGRPESVYVPRGPLGVQVGPKQVAPPPIH